MLTEVLFCFTYVAACTETVCILLPVIRNNIRIRNTVRFLKADFLFMSVILSSAFPLYIQANKLVCCSQGYCSLREQWSHKFIHRSQTLSSPLTICPLRFFHLTVWKPKCCQIILHIPFWHQTLGSYDKLPDQLIKTIWKIKIHIGYQLVFFYIIGIV